MDKIKNESIKQKLEQKNADITFARVDADTLSKLIEKDEEIPSKLNKDQEEKLKELVTTTVNDPKFTVQVASLNESEAPMIITQSEFMRRLKEQQLVGGGGMTMFGEMPESFTLIDFILFPLIDTHFVSTMKLFPIS